MTVGDILFSFGPLTLANLLVSEVENLGMSEGLFSAAGYCQVPIASKKSEHQVFLTPQPQQTEPEPYA